MNAMIRRQQLRNLSQAHEAKDRRCVRRRERKTITHTNLCCRFNSANETQKTWGPELQQCLPCACAPIPALNSPGNLPFCNHTLLAISNARKSMRPVLASSYAYRTQTIHTFIPLKDGSTSVRYGYRTKTTNTRTVRIQYRKDT